MSSQMSSGTQRKLPKTEVATAAEAARRARLASRKLAMLSESARNAALDRAAAGIEQNASRILAANADDVRVAEEMARKGQLSAAMLARLRMNERSVAEIAEKVRGVKSLADPLRRCLAKTELDEGLVLTKETCPLGVVAVVFESRPDVLPQVASLALKSGNAILLKGGTEAARTNEVMIGVWRTALAETGEIPADAAQMLLSRSDVMELLDLTKDVDLLIPRGGKEFVEKISRESRIPVLGHGEGVCHVYVHSGADLQKAVRIVMDAKTDYPAACNAAETLLIDETVATQFVPKILAQLQEGGVEVRGCEKTRAIAGLNAVGEAREEDWATEYGDLILSVKVVYGLEEALDHIHRYGSSHTETIVTEDKTAAERFLSEVDAAGVFHNASTRFADGYRYGLGAEVGISNGKLHARGPMGLEGLTTYKYKLRGDGQTVGDYKRGKRFTHRSL